MNNTDSHKEINECGVRCKSIEVPTDEELSALNALRKVKDRVREIKKRLSEIGLSIRREDILERSVLEDEMKALRSEWKNLEEKRERATRKRMILLGHEEGPL